MVRSTGYGLVVVVVVVVGARRCPVGNARESAHGGAAYKQGRAARCGAGAGRILFAQRALTYRDRDEATAADAAEGGSGVLGRVLLRRQRATCLGVGGVA